MSLLDGDLGADVSEGPETVPSGACGPWPENTRRLPTTIAPSNGSTTPGGSEIGGGSA